MRSRQEQVGEEREKASKPVKAFEVLRQKLQELSVQAAIEIGEDNDEEAITLRKQRVKSENTVAKREHAVRAKREQYGIENEIAMMVQAAKSAKGLSDMAPRVEPSRSRRRIPLHGVKVAFPFDEPLAPQRQVMERVVHAIVKEQTALLESPTGTGKTQALLSAALGAVRFLKLTEAPRVGKIIYATRTIGQVKQLPNELRKNPYVTTSVPLASRNHYCTNIDLVGKGQISSGALSQQCRKLGRAVEKARQRGIRDEENEIHTWDDNHPDLGPQASCGCVHYRKLTASGQETHAAARPICTQTTSLLPDLEDMRGVANICDLKTIAQGKPKVDTDGKPVLDQESQEPIIEAGPCAYYQARALGDQSSIIFCPYNYLMDAGIRSAVGIETHLDNAVVIIDEAHNVEQVARDGGSHVLSIFDIYDLEQFVDTRHKSSQRRRKEAREQRPIDMDKYGYEDGENDEAAERLLTIFKALRQSIEEAEADFCGDDEDDEEEEDDIEEESLPTGQRTHSIPPPPPRAVAYGSVTPATTTKKRMQRKVLRQAQISLRDRTKWKKPPEERDVVRGWDWGAAGGRPMTEEFFKKFELSKEVLMKANEEAERIAEAAREMDDDSFLLGDQCVMVAKILLMCYNNRVHYAVCVRAWHNAASEYPLRFGGKDRNSHQNKDDQDEDGSTSQQDMQQSYIGTDGTISRKKQRGASVRAASRFKDPDENGWYSTRRSDEPEWGFELCFWLLHPGVVIDEISSRARTLILASGTLSPVLQTERELGIKFSNRMRRKALEARHVCSTSHQLAVRAVTSVSVLPGRPPVVLECKANSFSEFTSEGRIRIQALGETVARLACSAPGGVLVFLPSNKLLKQLVKAWKSHSRVTSTSANSSSNIWRRLERHKRTVLCEQGDGPGNDEIIRRYREAIARDKSAMLFAVYRGKCSEGISYNDDACRLVIAIGIPFPPAYDHLVMRKKEYNDSKMKGGRELGCGQNGQQVADKDCMSGSTWYTCQAYRALNQALGRCLRHLNDWGALVLVDCRFAEAHARMGVAAWLRDALEPGTLDQVAKHLDTHYDTARDFVQRDFRERMGLPPIKPSTHPIAYTDTKIRPSLSADSTMAPASQETSQNPFSQYRYEPSQMSQLEDSKPSRQSPILKDPSSQQQPLPVEEEKVVIVEDDDDFYSDDEVVEVPPPPAPTPTVIDLLDDDDEVLPDANRDSSKRPSPTTALLEHDFPRTFFCQLTHELMSDPVVAADGHTYERTAIESHLAVSATSPVTQRILAHKHLTPNIAIKDAIREMRINIKRVRTSISS